MASRNKKEEDNELTSRWVPIEEIRPYEKNPRKNDGAVDAVANSIKEFGWQQLIVVDKDNVIIAGHTRYKAALKLGLSEVPVRVASDLTEEQVRAYRLADNKTHELSDWNVELLLEELESIDTLDMTLLGFDEHLIPTDIIEDDFEVDIPEEPRTELGDMYVLGDHILMCGDSTRSEDVLRLIGDEKADMIFMDPPWNVDYGQDHPNWKPRKILNDDMSTEDFEEFMRSAFARAKDASRDGAMVYVVMSAQE